MDKVLQSESQFALAYIDDITMFSHTWEAHRTDLQSVLQRLREAGLTVNVKKRSYIGCKRVTFLGYVRGNCRHTLIKYKY